MRVDHLYLIDVAGSNLDLAYLYGTSYPDAEFARLKILYVKGQYDELIEVANRQLAARPDQQASYDGWLQLAYLGLGEPEVALTYADRWIDS